jgi:hypothetical protein
VPVVVVVVVVVVAVVVDVEHVTEDSVYPLFFYNLYIHMVSLPHMAKDLEYQNPFSSRAISS